MEFETFEKKKRENFLLAILAVVFFVVFLFLLVKNLFTGRPVAYVPPAEIKIQTYILEDENWKKFWTNFNPFETVNLPSQEELGSESLF
jgi:hypothetical protein